MYQSDEEARRIMNLPEGAHLAYSVLAEAWYAEACMANGRHPEIHIMAAHPEGGVSWEFCAEQYVFGPDNQAVELRIFENAFAAFIQMPEFFLLMEQHRPTTLRGVRDILDGLGAVDETKRRRDGGKVVQGKVVRVRGALLPAAARRLLRREEDSCSGG